MDQWVTTIEAANIKKVGFSQHHIAKLAREGKIVAKKAGEKKLLVKVALNNGTYELVKMPPTKTEYVSVTEAYPEAPTNQKKLGQHLDELAQTASDLAKNMDKYLDRYGEGFESKVGKVIYGGWLEVDYYTPPTGIHDAFSVKMLNISKPLALNLLSHIKEKFPELEKVNNWANLTSKELTYDLVARLTNIANKGIKIGSCKDCPK